MKRPLWANWFPFLVCHRAEPHQRQRELRGVDMEDHVVIYTMVIIFNVIVYFASLTGTFPKELLVDIKFKPEVCYNRSESGQYVTYHYVCRNQVGKVLENTYVRRKPFEMQIGVGLLPQGIDEGIMDTCVGEKRHLVIPPSKTHQRHGKSDMDITSNGFLYVDLEVVAINTYATSRSFDCCDGDGNGRPMTSDGGPMTSDGLQGLRRTFKVPRTSVDEKSSQHDHGYGSMAMDEFMKSSLAAMKARDQWRTNPFRPPYEKIVR